MADENETPVEPEVPETIDAEDIVTSVYEPDAAPSATYDQETGAFK